MRNWFKRHEKGIVTGFFAAVLTVTGAAGYHIQNSYGYAYSYSKDGVTFVEIEPESSGVTEDVEEETIVVYEEAREGSLAQRQETGYESADTVINAVAEGSGDECWESEYKDLYEALGMDWNKKECYWTYREKPVKIIWEENGCFSSWGNVKKDNCTYIYVDKEIGDESVTYRLKELDWAGISDLYSKKHPGCRIE